MEQFLTPRMTYMSKPHVCKFPASGGGWRECNGKVILAQSLTFALRILIRGVEGWESSSWIGGFSRRRSADVRPTSMPRILNLYRPYGFIEGDKRQLDMSQFTDTQRKMELQDLLTPFEWWPMYRPAGGMYEPGKGMPPWEKQ